MSHTFTSTYTTLEVAKSSFDDIADRLRKVNVIDDYLTTDREYGDMILFGTVGLVVDPHSPTARLKGCCNFHGTGGPANKPCTVLVYRPGLDNTR